MIVEASPADDYAHFGLGLALARSGEPGRAAEYLALAAAMRPDLPHYSAALARRPGHSAARARPSEPAGAETAGRRMTGARRRPASTASEPRPQRRAARAAPGSEQQSRSARATTSPCSTWTVSCTWAARPFPARPRRWRRPPPPGCGSRS